MNKPTHQVWAAAQAAYMSGEMTVREIAAKFNISKTSVYKRIREDGWRCIQNTGYTASRSAEETGVSGVKTDEVKVVERLYCILDRILAEIELGLIGGELRSSLDRARDMRTLLSLVGILAKLNSIKPATAPEKDAEHTKRNEDQIRAEIAERLARLQALEAVGEAGRTKR